MLPDVRHIDNDFEKKSGVSFKCTAFVISISFMLSGRSGEKIAVIVPALDNLIYSFLSV